MITTPDGQRFIDPARADVEWAENSDPAKAIGGTANAQAHAERRGGGDENPTEPVATADAESDDEERDADADSDPSLPGGVPKFHVSRARKEAANAALAELNLKQKSGELALRDEVQKGAFALARIVREGIMGIPDRISGILAAETDAHKVHVLLSDELRRVLEELSRP